MNHPQPNFVFYFSRFQAWSILLYNETETNTITDFETKIRCSGWRDLQNVYVSERERREGGPPTIISIIVILLESILGIGASNNQIVLQEGSKKYNYQHLS